MKNCFNPKKQKRVQRTEILIVCYKTESRYFGDFKKKLTNIKLRIHPKTESPMQLVDYAIKKSSENKFNEVWCIFDKDEFDDFDSAIQRADNNGIKCAFSNQAFELWYLLHFNKYEGKLHRNRYHKMLMEKLPDIGEKPYNNAYELLKERQSIAIKHAKAVYQTKSKKYKNQNWSRWESCTRIYALVERLNEWATVL